MNYLNIYGQEMMKTQDYIPTHDGIGTLADVASCTVTRTVDGLYELDMTYPASGRYAEHLLPENLIRADLRRTVHSANPYLQFFRIVRAEYSLEAEGAVLSVHAEHLSSDLKWAWCKPVDLTTQKPDDCVNHIRSQGLNQVDQFTYMNVLAASGTEFKEFKHEEPFTKLEGLMEVASLFDGYVEPDNRTIKLLPKSRAVSAEIVEGRDILSLEISKDTSETVEGVYVYFKDDKYYKEPIVVIPQDSVCGVMHLAAYNFADESENPPINDSVVWDIADMWMKRHGQQGQRVTYSAKLADTGKQDFGICDKVLLSDPWLKTTAELQVQKIVYDVLRGRYEEIEAGSLRRDITDTVAGLVSSSGR